MNELRKLLAEATPGPWRWEYDKDADDHPADVEVDWATYQGDDVSLRGPAGSANSEMFPDLPQFALGYVSEANPADADLIVYLRNHAEDIAALIEAAGQHVCPVEDGLRAALAPFAPQEDK